MTLGTVMKVRISSLHRSGDNPGGDLVDTVDKLGRSMAQGTPGGRLVGFTARLGQGGVVGPVGYTNPVGVDAVEEDEVFFWLGDVDEDASQELEGVDERIVVLDGLPTLGLIEQELESG
jgi:hypothetical protein